MGRTLMIHWILMEILVIFYMSNIFTYYLGMFAVYPRWCLTSSCLENDRPAPCRLLPASHTTMPRIHLLQRRSPQQKPLLPVSSTNGWLVVEVSTPLKNISQLGWWNSQLIWENKKCSKPPTRWCCENQSPCHLDDSTIIFYSPFGSMCGWKRHDPPMTQQTTQTKLP